MRRNLFILFCFTILACNNTPKTPAAPTADLAAATTAAATPPQEDCPMTPEVKAIVGKALSLQVLEAMSDKEAAKWKPATGPCEGLCNQSFDTEYDAHCIFGVKRTAEYMGAYPSVQWQWLYFEKHSGKVLKATDIFMPAKMKELVKHCKMAIADTITTARKAVPAEDLDLYNTGIEHMAPLTTQTLDKFSVENDGIVIHYDFEFPHAVLGLQPDGNIRLTPQDMQTFVNPDGPLGYLIKK